MGLFLRNNHPLRYWGCLSFLNWIRTLTLSLLLILSSRKLEPLFLLWSLFLLRLLCISINLPCSLTWSSAVMSGLVLLTANKLQKWIYSTVGLSVAASLEPLGHRWNKTSLGLFYRSYFGRCSSEQAQMVLLPYPLGRPYSDRLIDFCVTIPRCCKDFYIHFFPCPARRCNSLPIECYPLAYDLNVHKFRINRDLFTVSSF